MPVRPRPPRKRESDPTRPGAVITEPGNPAWQANAKVGSRERVENKKVTYTWKRGNEGGLSERDIIVEPILGSRGDFNKQPIAKVIDADNIQLHSFNHVKYRYKSFKATQGALKRNNWVIYVQTAIRSVNNLTGESSIKYPQAISDIILQGMYYAQIDGEDAPIHPEIYSMLYKGPTREIVDSRVERSLDSNENYFTTNRQTILDAWVRFCEANNINSTNGLQRWDRYGNHTQDLQAFIQKRQNMMASNFINPSQRLIDETDKPPLMPGASIGNRPRGNLSNLSRKKDKIKYTYQPPATPIYTQNDVQPPTTPIYTQNDVRRRRNKIPPETEFEITSPITNIRSPKTPDSSEPIGFVGSFDDEPYEGYDLDGGDLTPVRPIIQKKVESSSSISLQLKESTMNQSARRSLFQDNPEDIFQQRLQSIQSSPKFFIDNRPIYLGRREVQTVFLTRRPHLPPLPNPKEAFEKITYSASNDFIEALCGEILLYLIIFERIVEPYPIFITGRGWNAYDNVQNLNLRTNTIYLINMNMGEGKFILTIISNYDTALQNSDANLIKVKMYMLSPDTEANFEELQREAGTIVNTMVTMIETSGSVPIKDYRIPITRSTFPLIIPMFFYQILEKNKKMIFEPEYFPFFKCNMLQMIFHEDNQWVPRKPTTSTFLFTNVCFEPNPSLPSSMAIPIDTPLPTPLPATPPPQTPRNQKKVPPNILKIQVNGVTYTKNNVSKIKRKRDEEEKTEEKEEKTKRTKKAREIFSPMSTMQKRKVKPIKTLSSRTIKPPEKYSP